MIGMQGLGQAYAFGRGQMDAKAAWMAQVAAGDQPSLGQRIVGKLDQNGDGQLGLNELKGTKFGARLSVDRFAKLDSNQDGALSAAEIDAGHKGRHAVESAVRMQMQGGAAGQIIAALGQNQTGVLNPQDVAGTKLGDLIGSGFGGIDTNGNGALDAKELAAFLVNALTAVTGTPATTADAATGGGSATAPAGASAAPAAGTATTASAQTDSDDAAGAVETGSEGSATDKTADAPGSATATPAAPGAGGTDPIAAITSSFEAALSVLQNGGMQPTAYDAVSSLYSQVQNIIAA